MHQNQGQKCAVRWTSFRMERTQREHPGLASPPDIFLWAVGSCISTDRLLPFLMLSHPSSLISLSPALCPSSLSHTLGSPPRHPLCPLLFQLSQCLGRQCTWLPPGLVAFPHQVPVGEGLCLSCLIDPLVPASMLGTMAEITLVNVKTRQQAAGVEGPGPPPALAADP